MAVCTVVVTVCIPILVYNNLSQTKKVAKETAEKTAIQICKKTFSNLDKIQPGQTIAEDLYRYALSLKGNKVAQMVVLKKAKDLCGDNDKETMNKIEILMSIVQDNGNYDEFDFTDWLNRT